MYALCVFKVKLKGGSGALKDDSGQVAVACRKSRRLIFKHNRQEILKNKNSVNAQDDSVQPFGRVVELIGENGEINRDDELTKFLFMGNLDLTPTPAPNCSTNTDTNEDSDTPAPVALGVASLKTLSIQAIAKQKRIELEAKETKYLQNKLVPGLSDSSSEDSISSSSANSICSPEESPEPEVFCSFEAHVTALIALKAIADEKDTNNNNLPSLKDCVTKVLQCGSRIRFSSTTHIPKDVLQLINEDDVQETKTKALMKEVESRENNWSSWEEHMSKIVQQCGVTVTSVETNIAAHCSIDKDIDSGKLNKPIQKRGRKIGKKTLKRMKKIS